ncbi:unnamed protein product [Vitrella brassicaformis CCMP3155]|uniref:Uncharacterized protein n=1 Tax=Vitrella brassicaformis (strain CCMP3155) TaxID=1169540 RepID=A0A0G4EDA4_VITBC|nr:unnamed protein product [Vitrella brassicaformis CCMP3155]|eukprot:CEL93973.1 unnamed protein product [Vitrella brassicaformis CCMP3155]
MSGGHDSRMASAAMADGDGGDAEEEHSGSGQAEDSDRNGADSGGQQQEGAMADEMADGDDGPQAADGDESDGMQDEDGDDDQDDDIDDRDSDDICDGHPLSDLADPTVPVPDGHFGLDELEARFPEGTSDATRELSRWIIGRRFTSAREVTDLIRQQRADPGVMTGLVGRDSSGVVYGYPLLCLAIDNKSDYTVPTIEAEDDDGYAVLRPVALPQWSSNELQRAVLTALLDGRADINAAADETQQTPIQVAIACGNEIAFHILMARQGIDLRASSPHMVMELPYALRPPPSEYLQVLMSMYRQLITRDPTLATEERYDYNLVHQAAERAKGLYPQSFIDAYLDLITANGADMTAEAGIRWTPLHFAALDGSPPVADYLCRKLPADQINRLNVFYKTPLALSAEELDDNTQQLQLPDTPEDAKDRHRAASDKYKRIIHSLLRAGGDINLIPTATEENRHQRQLVLTEYATVLNELPAAVMAAVNAALRDLREIADALTKAFHNGTAQQLKAAFPSFDPSLDSLHPPPLPPHVTPAAPWQDDETPLANRDMSAVAWRVASFFVDPSVLEQRPRFVQNATEVGRRINTAMARFVEAAASLQVVGNEEVVGNGGRKRDSEGQVVRRPQLQCFELNYDSRPREAVHTHGRVGLREVVHRARLDEAAKWGLADGAVVKGFNAHLGDADCQFTWQQLGAAFQ